MLVREERERRNERDIYMVSNGRGIRGESGKWSGHVIDVDGPTQ